MKLYFFLTVGNFLQDDRLFISVYHFTYGKTNNIPGYLVVAVKINVD